MSRHRPDRSTTFGLLLLAAACAGGEPVAPPPGRFQALETPAGPGSSAPNLTVGPEGRVYLSWIEPGREGAHALRFATLDGEAWSAARTIASGTGWFVNWADVPAMAALPDGRLAAHYLQQLADAEAGSHAYHVRVVQSADGGATWNEPVTPHVDRTGTEHGFVSLFAAAGDSLGVIWLDGRSFSPEHGATEEMALRGVSIAADGGVGAEAVVDGRTCECCQTSVAATATGPVVVYRDRAEGEIRDIHLARRVGGGWSEGPPVHRDGWEINGCPVNGPAVASDGGDRVVVAWFTGAGDTARVQASFSSDEGKTFGEPVRVDEGRPVGRVDVEMLADGSALVSWIESGDDDAARVLLRPVHPDGRRGEAQAIATSSGARSSGFPRMAVTGERVVLAWTEPGDPSHVRTARALTPRSRDDSAQRP